MWKWAKDHAGLLALLLSVISLGYTYSQDRERSRFVFSAHCNLVPDGRAGLAVRDGYPSLKLETKCALRNLGHRPADLVEVRTGVVYQGSLSLLPSELPARWEKAWDLTVNGEAIVAPVTVAPGSQANVQVMLGFPIDANPPGEKLGEVLKACHERATLETVQAVGACLRNEGLFWTDYLRAGGVIEVPGGNLNGVAGVFFLSDGSYVFDEVEFEYGWSWRCYRPGDLPYPHYIRKEHMACLAPPRSDK